MFTYRILALCAWVATLLEVCGVHTAARPTLAVGLVLTLPLCLFDVATAVGDGGRYRLWVLAWEVYFTALIFYCALKFAVGS